MCNPASLHTSSCSHSLFQKEREWMKKKEMAAAICQMEKKFDACSDEIDERFLKENGSLIQQIFCSVHEQYGIDSHTFPYADYRALRTAKNIMKCKTPVTGVVLSDHCEHCHTVFPHYRGCGDNCCPICGNLLREEWLNQQGQYLLDVPYYHIVFTVPDALNPLFLHLKKEMYSALFKAVADTLRTFARDSRYLGAEPGFMLNLHPGGRTLNLHPHIHALFCGVGMNPKTCQKVSPKQKNYLFPVKAVAKMFRGKFLEEVEAVINSMNGTDEVPVRPDDESNHRGFELKQKYNYVWENYDQIRADIRESCRTDWNVHLKETFDKGSMVMEYLGRYVSRIAITDSRIVAYENGKVRIRYKDNKDRGKQKEMTLTDLEFVRRFLLLVTPENFMRNRFYGFWGIRNRNSRFEKIRRVNQWRNRRKKATDMYQLINKMINHEKVIMPLGTTIDPKRNDASFCPKCRCQRHRPLRR